MSLYSDLPPASGETSNPAPKPLASTSAAPEDDTATGSSAAKPALLIPQINIVRQRPRPASDAAARKKPLMMKAVKPAAPIVNIMVQHNPPPPPPVELFHDREEEEKPHDEYDPAVPNEYLQLCRERRAERDRLQRERELQEFLRMQEAKQEAQPVEPLDLKMSGEDAYMRRLRMSGMAPPAAPAERAPSPPPAAPRSPSPEPYNPPVSVSTTQPVAKQSVAERLMAKMGWQSGQGLGAQGQGIKQALVAKKDGTGHLKIAEPVAKKRKQKADLGHVVLLENMVGKGEVDSELERETAEECKKFGSVLQCRIYERADDVRIFIKFDDDASATRAIDALNGRLFGGRRVRATSYDAQSFAKDDLDL